MLELTWDLPNNASLLVYECLFSWDNAIRQGEQMREGESVKEREAGAEWMEEDKNAY